MSPSQNSIARCKNKCGVYAFKRLYNTTEITYYRLFTHVQPKSQLNEINKLYLNQPFNKDVDPRAMGAKDGGRRRVSPMHGLGGQISNCPCPIFFICLMTFCLLTYVYCRHCLSLSYFIKYDTYSNAYTNLFFTRFPAVLVINLYYKLHSIDLYIKWALKTWNYRFSV